MIRYRPIYSMPWLKNGRLYRGDERFDRWILGVSVLNSTVIEYDNDTYLAMVRGHAENIDEIGTDVAAFNNNGFCILQADRSADIGDFRKWRQLHVEDFALKTSDIPAMPQGFEWWMSDMFLASDPTTVTNGHTRLYGTFRMKPRQKKFPGTVALSGGAAGTELPINFEGGVWCSAYENLKLTRDDTEAVLTIEGYKDGVAVVDPDARVLNEGGPMGTGGYPTRVELLKDFSGIGLTAEYIEYPWAGYVISDDGGQTWSYGGWFVDGNGRPEWRGQRAIWRESIDGHPWHMIRNAMSQFDRDRYGDVRPAYSRAASDPGADTWEWGDVTPIGTTQGAKGDWNHNSRIWAVHHREQDADGVEWCYATQNGGYTYKHSRGSTPDARPDWAAGEEITLAGDYPVGTGLYRCRIDRLTDRSSWEEYEYNPISIRPGMDNASLGGMWTGSSVVLGDGSRRVFFETVGTFAPGDVTDEQINSLRDDEYSVNDSVFVAPELDEYKTANGYTLHIRLSLDDGTGMIMSYGTDVQRARDPSIDAGSVYMHADDNRAIHVLYRFKGPGGGHVTRSIKTADDVMIPGQMQDIVLTVGPDAMTLYVDSNTPVATGAAPYLEGNPSGQIAIGAKGFRYKAMSGYLERFASVEGVEDFDGMSALLPADAAAFYEFDTFNSELNEDGTGYIWTVPDQSPNAEDGYIYGFCFAGHLDGVADTLRITGGGSGYMTSGGSQQLQMSYDAGSFSEMWDAEPPIKDDASVSLRHGRTGEYLALDGNEVVMSDTVYYWRAKWIKGFLHFNASGDFEEGDDVLTQTDRLAGGLSMEPLRSYVSPYNRFDLQQWHLVTGTGGMWTFQNRGSGYPLAGAGLGRMTGGFNILWQIGEA